MINPTPPDPQEVLDAQKTLRNLMESSDPYEPLNNTDALILANAQECLLVWYHAMNRELDDILGLAPHSDSSVSTSYKDGRWTAHLVIEPFAKNSRDSSDLALLYIVCNVDEEFIGYTHYEAVKGAYEWYLKSIQGIKDYIAKAGVK